MPVLDEKQKAALIGLIEKYPGGVPGLAEHLNYTPAAVYCWLNGTRNPGWKVWRTLQELIAAPSSTSLNNFQPGMKKSVASDEEDRVELLTDVEKGADYVDRVQMETLLKTLETFVANQTRTDRVLANINDRLRALENGVSASKGQAQSKVSKKSKRGNKK